ncbi:MAG: DNA polymerase IV [Coriobacteriia bacterium]|nr:DNA polymerase IV [Coriobacteriia bacterium]
MLDDNQYTSLEDLTTEGVWSGRAIAHLDLDAFFASVAQLDNPELRGKPVIVGGPSGRGVVSTCSYEARVYGVRSAMPSSQARRLCPDAIWVSSDFSRYRELSKQIFNMVAELTPHFRQVSIDEAFFEITPDAQDPRHPVTVVRELMQRIAETGITGSIGLSTSMTVAKIGSDMKKPRGLTVIPAGQEAAFLSPLPIRKQSGIGPKSAERLAQVGVKTLGQLADLDLATATLIFGKTAPTMLERAAGIDVRPVQEDEPTKSVSNEYTFDQDITTAEDIRDALADISAQLARRLRKKGLRGRCVNLKLRFKDFKTKSVSKTFSVGIDNEVALSAIAFEMAQTVWEEGMPVRLLGVGVSQFDEGAGQMCLFSDAALQNSEEAASTQPDMQDTKAENASEILTGAQDKSQQTASAVVSEEQECLSKRLDDIKDKFGESSVLSGRQLKQSCEDKPWKARSITGGPKPEN